MEYYYSAIKKNEIMPFTATWMDLEIIIVSEVRERQVSYDITYMESKLYKWTYLKNKNRIIDIENKHGYHSGDERGRKIRSLGLTYTHYYI